MVSSKGKQDAVDQQDMLEIVDDTFAIEEVHGGSQEVPVQRLGEAQVSRLAGNGMYGDDLFEGYYLESGDEDDDVDVTREEGPKEATKHSKSPYSARVEVLHLLLVFGLRWGLGLGHGQWGLILAIETGELPHKDSKSACYSPCSRRSTS